MIVVKRNTEDSSQKVLSTFVKRVKKSNLVARMRKIKHYSKALSHLQKKRKAIRGAEYEANVELMERIGKK
jgi:hypothetical protein